MVAEMDDMAEQKEYIYYVNTRRDTLNGKLRSIGNRPANWLRSMGRNSGLVQILSQISAFRAPLKRQYSTSTCGP